MVDTFILCLHVFLQILSASGQCIDESPMPPVVAPTSWTAWYSVDDPTDGTDDETLTAVRAVYPSVCISPTLAECRLRFIHLDHISAGQVLATSCTPTGGLLCQSSDQSKQETCLDYELRFECPTPHDALPDPHFYWDLSTKTSIDADEPMTCDGTVKSIYPNIGGMTGTVVGPLNVTDGYDSSDHLCALRKKFASADGYVDYGSANDKCISETACCTSGWSITFWMRYRSPSDSNTKYIFTTGGQLSSARGISIHVTAKFSLYVRGDESRQAWEMKMADTAIFPTDQWTHHCFTYDPLLGTKYYKDGVLRHSLGTVSKIDAPYTNDFDNVRMFVRSDTVSAYKPKGDFSDFKMFYKTFNATEVQNSYLKETSESELVIHYLRKHSHGDSFDIELECLAKAGSQPRITWYRSDDGAHFYPVSPSADVAIYESLPNSYRRRSVLMVRSLTFSTDAIFVCEASDVVKGGSLSKIITIPKRDMYWTPWLSADSPADGDDRETLVEHREAYYLLCKYPSSIQCRTVYDGIPSNKSGQILNIDCTVSSGLECVGADQSDAHGNLCYDYEVRYLCPQPSFRWTNWYDAKDPDGSVENESFDGVHLAQSYPDLCSQPIGAECRIKGTNQDLIASGFVPEVPYLCNANGFRCQHADNTGPCPDFEVRYRCPDTTGPDLRIESLTSLSPPLDPSLILRCSATIGVPMMADFNLGWAWFDHARPPYAVVPLSQSGIVTITPETSVQCCESSSLTIEDFSSSLFANKTIACIARDGIVIDVETFEVKPPTFNGQVSVSINGDVIIGGTVILLCSVSGDKIYTVDWYRRAPPNDQTSTDELLVSTEDGRYNINKQIQSSTSGYLSLEIQSLSNEDNGDYICSVNRGLGVGILQLYGEEIQTGSTAGATVIHTTKFYTSPSSALDSLPTTPRDQLTGEDLPTTTAKNEDALTSRLTEQSPNGFTPSPTLKLMTSSHVTTQKSADGEVTTENNSTAKETNVTPTVVSETKTIIYPVATTPNVTSGVDGQSDKVMTTNYLVWLVPVIICCIVIGISAGIICCYIKKKYISVQPIKPLRSPHQGLDYCQSTHIQAEIQLGNIQSVEDNG